MNEEATTARKEEQHLDQRGRCKGSKPGSRGRGGPTQVGPSVRRTGATQLLPEEGLSQHHALSSPCL